MALAQHTTNTLRDLEADIPEQVSLHPSHPVAMNNHLIIQFKSAAWAARRPAWLLQCDSARTIRDVVETLIVLDNHLQNIATQPIHVRRVLLLLLFSSYATGCSHIWHFVPR